MRAWLVWHVALDLPLGCKPQCWKSAKQVGNWDKRRVPCPHAKGLLWTNPTSGQLLLGVGVPKVPLAVVPVGFVQAFRHCAKLARECKGCHESSTRISLWSHFLRPLDIKPAETAETVGFSAPDTRAARLGCPGLLSGAPSRPGARVQILVRFVFCSEGSWLTKGRVSPVRSKRRPSHNKSVPKNPDRPG